ncbi:hypothetical protein G7Y89_g14226 [Cudoniella acicularis]|uniref:Uncharacterized protein n=1 Tax=Cudoniella acicularis TaxID=354080 RepID=A0A8H4VU96_9HELO|nr:hypothetical protein G7Y89_g14226 [Cudoniella acicularis]
MADFGTFTGAYNTFVDASLAFIPSTIFWSLQMNFQEKFTLSVVFALNVLFVPPFPISLSPNPIIHPSIQNLNFNTNKNPPHRTSIISAIKTSYLSQLANRTDFTWATYDIFAYVTAEFFLITVCGSLPTLKPLLDLFLTYLSPFLTKVTSSGFSRNSSYTRHTEDERGTQLELRKDVKESEATVSNSRHGSSGREALDDEVGLTGGERRGIRVEKSYKIRVDTTSESSDRELSELES